MFNPSAGRRILIVEDDIPLAKFLQRELTSESFVVDLAHDGETAIKALQEARRYDLVVLDLNLPKLDGVAVLQQLRPTQPRLPVLVLTARNRVEDRVMSLENGADDCINKPFSFTELLARVRALMRRNSGQIPSDSKIGDLTLSRDEHKVERNGRKIDLTPREFAILEFLMRHSGCPVSRATLLQEVWNIPFDPSTNIVDVYMKYVRDKVDHPGERKLTHTIRGVGYQMSDG